MLPTSQPGRVDRHGDRPSVSLIMPVWRPRADWLATALRTALDDDAVSELVVVDDGNEPPLELPVDDERIVLVRAEHAGPYGARDAGLGVARGDYVRFVDADDVTSPGSTSVLLARLDGRHDLIAYGQTVMTDEDLRPTKSFVEHREGDVTTACLLGSFAVFHVAMLFPRAVVDAAGPWQAGFRVSGDWDFVLRAIEQAPVVRIDDVVSTYRRSPGSVMSRAHVAEGAQARARVIARFCERHPEASDLGRRATVRLYRDRTRALAWQGERGPALRSWMQLARLAPVGALRLAASLARSRLKMRSSRHRVDGVTT